MNFLAHYYTLKTNTDPYMLLGTVMPDMVTDFSRIYNKDIQENFSSQTITSKLMYKGIELHIKGDHIFHEHPIFLDFEKFTKKVLDDNEKITVKRKFVIAHVLVELLVDNFIINTEKGILEQFYHSIGSVEIAEANKFYSELNIEEEKSNFKKNFEKFNKLKFLFHLKENEGVIFTLDKVFGKIFAYDFLKNKIFWEESIETIKDYMKMRLPELLDDIKTKLYE